MEKWVVAAKKADFKAVAEKFGIDPVVARILRNRGLTEDAEIDEFLNGDLSGLHDPRLMKGMEEAAAIVREKIASKAKIRIIGDYDIDGVMSTYILYRGLTELGGTADYKIPNRIIDGYGINDHLVREAAADGIDTIITCDNGISAGPQVELAKSLGMTVVVTDHHDVLELPKADAVVDAKQEGETYPYRELCGAAVAWKLILALGGDKEMDLLQYAAFATIGDVVDLTGENRIIVKEGLKRLRQTDNPGLKALASACGTDIAQIDTYQVGFVLGPCINASGRLDTAAKAIQLLTAGSEVLAARMAEELKSLNDSRKAMTEDGVARAEAIIEEEKGQKVYVLYLPDLHESLAGIVAGRIREKYSHPTFVVTKSEDGLKASGRSIEKYSMFEELAKVKDLFTRFGGHPMAAGLSLPEENLESFKKRINEECALEEEDFVPKVTIDVPMPVAYATEELTEQLEALAPFGKANPKPLFADRQVSCTKPRIFGAKRNVLKTRVRSLSVPGDAEPERIGMQLDAYGDSIDAVAFGDVEKMAEKIDADHWMSIVYTLQFNEYMGEKRMQINIKHFR